MLCYMLSPTYYMLPASTFDLLVITHKYSTVQQCQFQAPSPVQNSCTSRDLLIPQHAAHVLKACAQSLCSSKERPERHRPLLSCAFPVRNKIKVESKMYPNTSTWLLSGSCTTATQRHPRPLPEQSHKCGPGFTTHWAGTGPTLASTSASTHTSPLFSNHQALSCQHSNRLLAPS